MKSLLTISAAIALAGAVSAQAATTTCTDTPKQYGSITIKKDGSKCLAEINADGANYLDPVVITETETVDSVYYFRKNTTSSSHQTISLPVAPSDGCKPKTIGGNLSKIKKIYRNKDSIWTVLTNPVTTSSAGFEANNPYLVSFGEKDDNGFYLKLSGCTYDLNTTIGSGKETYSANPEPQSPTGLTGTWEFRGVYENKTWAADDTERSVSYGFAGRKTDNNSVGKFVKAGANANVPPLRAYLVYNSKGSMAKPAPGASFAPASDNSDLIPASMEVLEEGDCFQEGDGIFKVRFANGKKTACFDGRSEARLQSLSIPEAIEVDSVAYNRKFATGSAWDSPAQASTIVFPFTVENQNCIENASFFDILYFNTWSDGADNITWQIYVNQRSADLPVYANRPYIVVASDTSIVFKDKINDGYSECKYTLKTEALKDTIFTPNGAAPGTWTFQGTYERIEFNETTKKGIYGFAGENKGNVSLGQFIKAAAGASVPPMRAYLKYNSAGSILTKSAAGTETSKFELPETILVKLVDDDGNTTTIGSMNTSTGVITMNENKWFDMKGRVLNKKPTAKGTYYNKGQKVIIK